MIVANGDEGDHSYEDKCCVGDSKDKMTAGLLVAVIVTMAFLWRC